jgi:hypothetical protein
MPKPTRSLFLFAALYLLGAASPAGFAKPTTGSLTGVVLSVKGAAVPSARVFWELADGSAPHATRADLTGHFRVPSVHPGLYELRGEAGGMWSDWEHNVLVRAGAEGHVTLRLLRETPPPAVVGLRK